jgi:LmbE family N-acetylglucosaminyl deacetylase
MNDAPPLDRVLIIAPHPDDDVIGAGGLIQRVVAHGGAIRVLVLTRGESNAWPQRAMLRKWSITAHDRDEWATLRAREAVAGLEKLGAAGACAHFLAYPDTQLSRLARASETSIENEIAQHARELQPTLAIVPSVFDYHTDHRAAGWYCHRAIDPKVIATYVVHGKVPSLRSRFTLHLSEDEQRRKREAIGEHASQLLLSRDRFLSYARATETFYIAESDVLRVDSATREKFDRVRHVAYAVTNALRYRARR